MKKHLITYSLALLGLCIYSCKKDSNNVTTPVDPGAGNQENITKVIVNFREPLGLGPFPFCAFNDPDGSGGKLPTIDTLKLSKGGNYELCSVLVLDETKSPIDTVSNEILKEGAYHWFHYTYTADKGNTSAMSFKTIDKDKNGLPIGLKFTDSVGASTGTGTFNVNLRHFSNGLAKNSDSAAGEADIFVDFPVQVK